MSGEALNRIMAQAAEAEALQQEMEDAFAAFLSDCHYPVGKNGEVMQSTYFVTHVAYHMVRCGWRPSAAPVIKKRKVDAPGVVEDAVEWVDVNAPDDPLAGVEQMTFAQISALPEYLRRKAIRRLGGTVDVDDDLPQMAEPAWQVTPNISYSTEQPSGEDFTKTNGAAQ